MEKGQTIHNFIIDSIRPVEEIKAEARKAGKTKKYVGIRYESSNPDIAQVSPRGVIKARKKGRCKIYAYTQNGSSAAIKVIVK